MFPLPSELEEVYADAVERDQRLADLLLVDGWTAANLPRPYHLLGRSTPFTYANRPLTSARADPPVLARHLTDWTDVPPLDFRI